MLNLIFQNNLVSFSNYKHQSIKDWCQNFEAYMHVSKIEKSPDYTVCPVCNRMQDHLLVLKEEKNS